jgi:hypothetical protein
LTLPLPLYTYRIPPGAFTKAGVRTGRGMVAFVSTNSTSAKSGKAFCICYSAGRSFQRWLDFSRALFIWRHPTLISNENTGSHPRVEVGLKARK